jgi:N-formylglutamate amidohydrolase
MTSFDAPDPYSACPANAAPSLADSLSEASPKKFSSQSVDLQSDELTGLPETYDKNSLLKSFGPVILPLSALQPAIFSTVETLRLSGRRPPNAVVLSCPHAGRIYPAEFITASIADITDLRGLEDFGVDQIIGDAVNHGIPCVTNKITRAYIDVNRPVDALDNLMLSSPPADNDATPSRHVRAGYGLLPRLTAARKVIHRQLLPYDEVERRIALVYQPYHCALQSALNIALRESGHAILIDCHSMPSHDQQNQPLADIVLGDLNHNTLDQKIGKVLASLIEGAGYSIAWNSPYAGGYITKNYGRANSNQQSIQIEINRRLYMSRKYELDDQGVKRVSGLMTKICAALSDIVGTV